MVPIIFLRGAGEMASGIALALWRQGFSRLVLQECARPTAIRRAVCFSEAVYEGTARVHGLLARHVASPSLCAACWQQGEIALLTGSEDAALTALRSQVFIEATLRKRGAPLEKSWAAFVLALGPGFLAGEQAHAVMETHPDRCGEVLWQGQALAPTGELRRQGQVLPRVVHAPQSGIFHTSLRLGDAVAAGQVLGFLDGDNGSHCAVAAGMAGRLRGLLRDGSPVREHGRVADIENRPHIGPQSLSARAGCLGDSVCRLVTRWWQQQGAAYESS